MLNNERGDLIMNLVQELWKIHDFIDKESHEHTGILYLRYKHSDKKPLEKLEKDFNLCLRHLYKALQSLIWELDRKGPNNPKILIVLL